MDPVLIKLLRLRLRGALRRSFRGLKTVRGMLFFLLGAGTLLLWIGSQFLVLFIPHARGNPEVLRDVLPVGLFGLSLMSLLGGTRQEGICFTPAEVDFLFSGPFTRRHLLLYKLSSGMLGSLFAAIFISLLLMRYASLWAAAFIGGTTDHDSNVQALTLILAEWSSSAERTPISSRSTRPGASRRNVQAVTAYTARTSLPSTRTPGMPYPAARPAIGAANCRSDGTEIAHPLF
jgi:hypothetical protein